MKILHYIPTYAPAWQWGGPVRSVSVLCEELVRQGHDVTVFTTDAGLNPDDIPCHGELVMRNGVKVHYFPRISGYGIKSPQLEQAVQMRAKEFDLIHVTAIWQRTGSAACWAAEAAGVPYVISPRGALSPYSWTRGLVKKLAYYFLRERQNLLGAAGFHYTTTLEATECERFRFGKPSCVVFNAVDLDFWRYEENAGKCWRANLGISDQETVLLYAGRLHHKKGLDLLPEVLRQCRSGGLSVRLVFVGPEDDDTGSRLRKQFAKLNIDKFVTFLPLKSPDKLKAAYSGAEIFLLPSRNENFGNAAIEAAACGCLVLASNQTGVAHELVRLGVGECLALDARVWSSAIARAKKQRLNPELVALIQERFRSPHISRQMGSFYETLATAIDENQN